MSSTRPNSTITMRPIIVSPASDSTANGARVRETLLTAGQLLTAEQVGARWQVPKAHVYRLAREGHLPVVMIGRYQRFQVAAIEEWEQAGGCGHE